jgi:uncharacterized RDD family membrane protein YckC
MEADNLHNVVYAGLFRRLVAALYDWLLVIALMMVASVPLVAPTDEAITPGNSLYRFALVVLTTAFFTGFWTRGGQTLGMRAWRLRLVTADGSKVSFARALLRFACACVSAMPCGLGFIWMLFDREQLSWHDRWSGTRIQLLPKNAR